MAALGFVFKEGAKWKSGRFEFKELSVTGTGEDTDISYSDIELYLDDKLYEGGISSWRENNLSAYDIFTDVFNAYLRDSREDFKAYDSGWDVFRPFVELYSDWNESAGCYMKIPQYDYKVKIYELQYATPSCRYYQYDDEYLLLDPSGSIITNYENFYTEGLFQDLANSFQGKEKCLFISDDVKNMVKEYGGKEWFIENCSIEPDPDI